MKSIFTICFFIMGAFSLTFAQQIVTSGTDSGAGTLREALTLVPNNEFPAGV